jgi:integrase
MATERALPRGIRKTASGKYQIRYTGPDGRRYSGGTFRRKIEAEKALSRVEASIEAGTWQALASAADGGLDPRTVTLRQLSNHWLKIRVNRQGRPLSHYTSSEYRRYIETSLSEFANKPIRSITPTQVEKWWSARYETHRRATNAAYKYLKSLLTWAEKRRLILENPCQIEGASTYTPKEEPAVPTTVEVDLMIQNAEGPLRAIVALMAYCGLRKGEVFELRRKDLSTIERGEETWWVVNISRSVAWITEAETTVGPPKTPGSVRSLVVPRVAERIILDHLATVPDQPEALLFSRNPEASEHWRKSQVNPLWRALRTSAGYSGRFQSLRHYHLTQYSTTGASLREIMDRGGHRNIQVAMKYQRAAGRELDLIERLG